MLNEIFSYEKHLYLLEHQVALCEINRPFDMPFYRWEISVYEEWVTQEILLVTDITPCVVYF